MDYWNICTEEALSEVGIEATADQTVRLADMMRNASSMEREATGVYEQHQPSLTPKPKLGWSEPWCMGGRYYMSGEAPDENWAIKDRDADRTYYFNSEKAARSFQSRNA